MLNNNNKILIGLLTFVLVCIIGYSLFSESITVTGTATVQGTYNITTTCTAGYSEEFLAFGIPSQDYGQSGFENSKCNVTGSTVTASVDLLYPTANRAFTVKMKNTGTIPALIYGSKSSGRVESLYFDSTERSFYLKNKETNEIIKSGVGNEGAEDYANISGAYVFSASGSINPDENIVYDSSKKMAAIKLNPGDSVVLIVGFVYEDSATSIMSDNGKSEYIEFKLTHDFKWEQFVDSPNLQPTTFYDWCFGGC